MKTPPNNNKRTGFTLIEIMVVVLILGLMVSVVGPNVWNALVSNQAKIAGTQIHGFHGSLDQYFLVFNKYPDSLEELLEPDPVTGESFMKSIPVDPWQNEYQYERDGDGDPMITCFGADGAPGGEGKNQDITSESQGL